MPDDRKRAVVQARRLRSAILQRHGYQSESDISEGEHSNTLADAAGRAAITAHWGIVSDVPVLGRPIVLSKRVMRIALRWYINPIVQQQNAFNDTVVRALYELQAENDRLRARIAALETDGSQE